MIAPSYLDRPKSGNDYMLTVQYPENQVRSFADLRRHPPPCGRGKPIPPASTPLPPSTRRRPHRGRSLPAPPRHRRLRPPADEDLGGVAAAIDDIVADTKVPEGLSVDLRGMVQGMRASFQSFGSACCLAVVLLYLILVAQFRSFLDPLLILLAVPPGLAGVLLTL